MATSNQIKGLLKAHFESDDEKFRTVALQIAAAEAKKGHTTVARELKEIIEKSKIVQKTVANFDKNVSDMLSFSVPDNRLSELVVTEEIKKRLMRILKEYRQRDKLKKHGLENRRKILISGPPGTGKTMTASIIASELHFPLYTVLVDKLVTKYMGETSVKLRQIFDSIYINKGVYLFDEFDAIGSKRSLDNDVGEIRRVLNSFLQFIEQDDSDSIIIAATNNPQLLDEALFRRFDDVLYYNLPNEALIEKLILNKTKGFTNNNLIDKNVLGVARSLSHADISRACEDVLKCSILDNVEINNKLLLIMLMERKLSYHDEEV